MRIYYDIDRNEFEHEPDDRDVTDALKKLVTKEERQELDDTGDEDELIIWYKDDLEAYFEDEAVEAYNDMKEYERNPYNYYGLNERNYH